MSLSPTTQAIGIILNRPPQNAAEANSCQPSSSVKKKPSVIIRVPRSTGGRSLGRAAVRRRRGRAKVGTAGGWSRGTEGSRRRRGVGSPAALPATAGSGCVDGARRRRGIRSRGRGVEGAGGGRAEACARGRGVVGVRRGAAWAGCVAPRVVAARAGGRGGNTVPWRLVSPCIAATAAVGRSLGTQTEAIRSGCLRAR